MRRHRAHVRRGEARQHEAPPGRRQEIHERLHVSRLAILETRVEDDGGEARDDPRPGSERVVRDLEEQRGEHAVLLGAGAEDALGDVAAAAGLGARIPGRPPLHGEIDAQREEWHPCVGVKTGGRHADRHDGQRGGLAPEVLHQLDLHHVDAADRARGVDGQDDDGAHLEDELDEIGPQHGPHPRGDGIESGDGEAYADGDDLSADGHPGYLHVLKAE